MEQNVAEHKPAKTVSPIAGTDALHSIQETCVTLGIGPTKCWELIGQGKLSVVRLGARCTRIKRSSIDELIKNGARA